MELEDKGDKKVDPKKADAKDKKDDFFDVKEDPILNNKDESKAKKDELNDDKFFNDIYDDLDFEANNLQGNKP